MQEKSARIGWDWAAAARHYFPLLVQLRLVRVGPNPNRSTRLWSTGSMAPLNAVRAIIIGANPDDRRPKETPINSRCGNQLCNKCGLFERRHLRPRPEQFSLKHPLSSSTPRRSPGSGSNGQQSYQHPSPSPASASYPPTPSSAPPSAHQHQHSLYLLPLAPHPNPNSGSHYQTSGEQNHTNGNHTQNQNQSSTSAERKTASHPGTPNPQNAHANGSIAASPPERERVLDGHQVPDRGREDERREERDEKSDAREEEEEDARA
ncbi:hypothetical protein DFH07DRAFT_777198 [Mycena maculata]|uniref:GATA-type domain-containing protein n=1 Tax=Mycena maculata TaxID=230809 RepID=A0AAD7IIT3_9AGAR|nr:hypothetical protein DFH07DRAFT_777198 [Mycena maculata]